MLASTMQRVSGLSGRRAPAPLCGARPHLAAVQPPACRQRLLHGGLATMVPRATPSKEGEQAEEAPFDVPHTGVNAPMSEDKRAATPEQGAAPEGDRAIMGQAWQPTKADGETAEERFGSAQEAEEAKEASKDRSKKSKLQTGDEEGGYAEGSA